MVRFADGVYRQPLFLACPNTIYFAENIGKAVVSAADPLSLDRCNSAAECENAPKWQDTYWTDLPAAWYSQIDHIGIFERTGDDSGQIYWLAHDANQGVAEVAQSFLYESESQDGNALLDDSVPEGDYESALVSIHAQPNIMYQRRVSSVSKGRVTFDGHPLRVIGKFSFQNLLRHLDGPGEFVVRPSSPGKARVYLIPIDRENAESGKIEIATRLSAATQLDPRISIAASTIDGLVFEGSVYRGTPRPKEGRGELGLLSLCRGCPKLQPVDLKIRNTTFRFSAQNAVNLPFAHRLLVSDSRFHTMQGHVRCLMFTGGGRKPGGKHFSRSRDVTVQFSRFDACGAGAVIVWQTEGALIRNIEVSSVAETHGNAMSVYLYSQDILIAESLFHGMQRPVTVNSQTGQITLWRNVTRDNPDCQGLVRQWATKDAPGRIVAINNTDLGGECAINTMYRDQEGPKHVHLNNIVPCIFACSGARFPNAVAVTGPQILYNWSQSWVHRGRVCAGYKDHKKTVKLNSGLSKVIENADGAYETVGLTKKSPARGSAEDPTLYLPIERFAGRYDFQIREGVPMNMGADLYGEGLPKVGPREDAPRVSLPEK